LFNRVVASLEKRQLGKVPGLAQYEKGCVGRRCNHYIIAEEDSEHQFNIREGRKEHLGRRIATILVVS